jgi:streptogramin lyase
LTKGQYAGDVIVSHHAGNVIYRIHPADGQARIFLEKNLSQSFGLAINSQGEIFVGSSDTTTTVGRGWITKFAPDGTFMGQFVDLGNSEGDGIAFDSQDNLWVVNANAVFKITPSGQRTLVSAVPYEGVGIAICKDSATTSANVSSSQPHFPLELTALWLCAGLYAFAKRKIVRTD